jgi:hypothetical protein
MKESNLRQSIESHLDHGGLLVLLPGLGLLLHLLSIGLGGHLDRERASLTFQLKTSYIYNTAAKNMTMVEQKKSVLKESTVQ